MSNSPETIDPWGVVALIALASLLILSFVSEFFGGECTNIINKALDGLAALTELALVVGPLLIVVVAGWWLIEGKERGLGTISWYSLGTGLIISAVGILLIDYNFALVATENCVNGTGFF